jgi:iron(III) transport system substrate-binding protein
MIRLNFHPCATLLAIALATGSAAAYAEMPAWEKALYEAAKKEMEFSVYTAHFSTEEAASLCSAFEKKYPGVKCNFVRTTAQVAFQRLQQDMQSKQAVATVFSSTDVSHYPELKKSGA